jgi:TetR/AcrR family transcriptional regulator, repressor for neighboring sulfatase
MRPAKKKTSRPKRLRRTPDAVRVEVLRAARKLLLKSGPEAITLPAVAKELGMSHGNITHHFGSVGALHASLVDQMAHEFAAAVSDAVAHLRDESADPIAVVNAVFDAFAAGGVGQLISWLASTSNMKALDPLFSTVTVAVRELAKGRPRRGEARKQSVQQNALALIAAALGDALIGARLHASVGLPAATLRKLAADEMVRRAFGPKT